jgi:hypothetical protein
VLLGDGDQRLGGVPEPGVRNDLQPVGARRSRGCIEHGLGVEGAWRMPGRKPRG